MEYGKYVQRLMRDSKFRDMEPNFVVEGERWLKEVASHGIEPVTVIVTDEWYARTDEELKSRFEIQVVAQKEFGELSGTKTPAGVMAVIPKPQHEWPDQDDLVLVLDGLRDPGNVGTLIRTCTAAGVKVLVLTPGTTSVWNPKVVRSSMGSLLRLPIFAMNWDELAEKLKSHAVMAADMQGIDYASADWKRPSALIVGNEAHGLSQVAKALAEEKVMIRMADTTESLNAAIAGSVILFEVARQRGIISAGGGRLR